MKLNNIVRFFAIAILVALSAVSVSHASAGSPRFHIGDIGGSVPTDPTVVVSSYDEVTPHGIFLVGENDVYELVIDGDRTGRFVAANPNSVPDGRPTLILGNEDTPRDTLDPIMSRDLGGLCIVETEIQATANVPCLIGS